MRTATDRKAEAARFQQLTEDAIATAKAVAVKEHTITLGSGAITCFKSFSTAAALHYVSNLVENGVRFTYTFE